MFIKESGMKKSVTFILTIAMIFSIMGFSGWGNSEVYGATESEINFAVEDTIEAYFKTEKGNVINDFYELVAVVASGENLESYELSLLYSTTSSAVIGNLITGNTVEAERVAKELISENQLIVADNAFNNALNIIAIEAYNRTMNEDDKLSYSTSGAISNLLNYRTESIFLDSFNNQPSSEQAGMALVALSMFKGNEVVDEAISFAISQIKETQHSDGAFEGAWGAGKVDANTTAVVIWGIMAADKDNYDSYITGGAMTPTDGILSFLVSGGGYWYNDNTEINGYATKQAALAMADIKNGNSFFTTFTGSSIQYVSTQCQVITEDGNYSESVLTMGNDKSINRAIQRNLKTDSEIDFSDYNVYINGTLEEDPATKELKEGDSVLAISTNYSKIAYFKTKDDDTLGVNKATIDFEASIELTLILNNLSTGEDSILTNSAVNCGTAVASNYGKTNKEGKVTITPVEAITNKIIALKSGYIASDADIAILPAYLTMTSSGKKQTADVKLRIEGPDSNILNSAFAVVRSDGSRLTVYDAVTQGLDRLGISYVATDKYITSINGIAAGTLGYEKYWDGWKYTLTDEEHLNGTKSIGGMGEEFISDGDEIVVYYANDSFTTVYPILDTSLNSDGSVTVKVQSYVTDWTTGKTNLSPTSGVEISWGYISGTALMYKETTGEDGSVVIPKEYADLGHHSIQINKSTNGLPDIVRLAPNYTVELKEDSIGDGGTTPKIEKSYITVKGPSKNLKSRTPYSWYKGMTALDILKSTGLNMKISNKYVQEIEGYGEFSLGENSGWLYSVNALTPPTTPASEYTLASGDEVLWYYTKDYTKDKSSSKWQKEEAVVEEVEIDDEQNAAVVSVKMEAKTDAEGKAEANINAKDVNSAIEKAVSEAKKEGEKTLTEVELVIEADSKAKVIAVNLPKITVEELDKKVDIVSVKTPLGEITFDKKSLNTLAKNATEDLVFKIEKRTDIYILSDSAKSVIGDRGIFDLDISSGKNNISQFGGMIEVNVPYAIGANENNNNLVMGYIKNDGTLELLKESAYDAKNKKMKFKSVHLSEYAVVYVENKFADIEKHWAKEYVNYLSARDVVGGMSDTTFGPNNKITRAQLTQILANMSGQELTGFTKEELSKFSDVNSNAWYSAAVAWGSKAGVITGSQKQDGSLCFNPSENISRQDMAVMISRYMAKVDGSTLPSVNKEVKFSDDGNISNYAKKSVTQLQKAGIINGKTLTTFLPKDNASRAECSKMITVLMQNCL